MLLGLPQDTPPRLTIVRQAVTQTLQVLVTHILIGMFTSSSKKEARIPLKNC
jgi:hypothetical protein